jgi:molecular chaperone GrpE
MASEDSPPDQPQGREPGGEVPVGPVEPIGTPPAAEPRKSLDCEILERLEVLARLFEDKLAYDEFKEGQITRLHSELQEYKTDLLARTALPLIHGMIRLHDDSGKILDAARREASSLTPERLIHSIESFREDLEGLLADNGVSTYQAPDGSFDPYRQRALRTISTPDASLAGRVAERLRPGFERGTTIVMKERVAVYIATPTGDSGRGDSSERMPATAVASESPNNDSRRQDSVS